MSITHEQAHKLIQLNMENMLDGRQAALLSVHLRECVECHQYESEIREVTELLPSVMKKQWNARPIPLSIPALLGSREKTKARVFLTMRTAAVSLGFMALFFGAWNLGLARPSTTSEAPLEIPVVPTPLMLTASSTSTQRTDGCALMAYRVQEEDSLSSIAGKFSVSEEELLQLNHLDTEIIDPSMELLVPLCNSTPTRTTHPATFTSTYTPMLHATTSEPGG